MPRITYIEHDGTPHTVEVPEGQSVMNGAVAHGVPGIDADCGGACACATCHVYVEPDWVERAGARQAREAEMLEMAADTQANSRLACQIRVSQSLDGLVVRMPQGQH